MSTVIFKCIIVIIRYKFSEIPFNEFGYSSVRGEETSGIMHSSVQDAIGPPFSWRSRGIRSNCGYRAIDKTTDGTPSCIGESDANTALLSKTLHINADMNSKFVKMEIVVVVSTSVSVVDVPTENSRVPSIGSINTDMWRKMPASIRGAKLISN